MRFLLNHYEWITISPKEIIYVAFNRPDHGPNNLGPKHKHEHKYEVYGSKRACVRDADAGPIWQPTNTTTIWYISFNMGIDSYKKGFRIHRLKKSELPSK